MRVGARGYDDGRRIALASLVAASLMLAASASASPAADSTSGQLQPQALRAEHPAPEPGKSPDVEPEERSGPPGEHVPGEVIIAFRRGASAAERSAVRAAAGAEVIRPLRLPRVQLLSLEPGTGALAASRALERLPEVRFAHPNYIARYDANALRAELEPGALPNDPAAPQQWAIRNVGQAVNAFTPTADADADAPGGWAIRSQSPDVVVAVVDSGVDLGHDDLTADIWTNPGEMGLDASSNDKRFNGIDDDGNGYVDDWRGYNWADGHRSNPSDVTGHGSHVAGIAAARGGNGAGITGVTQRAKIMALRTGGNDGSTAAAVTDAFDYAGDMGAKVVNASLGAQIPPAAPELSSWKAAIDAHPDVLYVTSAGNDGIDVDAPAATRAYPCFFTSPNLLCVANSHFHDDLSATSNYGATSVDLAAPGTLILSDYPFGSPRFSFGFDSGVTGWTKDPNSTVNTWGVTSDGRLSDSPGGDYANNRDLSIISPVQDPHPIDSGSCLVRYAIKSELGSNDVFTLEMRTGPGAAFNEKDRVTTDGGWRVRNSATTIFVGTPGNPPDPRHIELRFRLQSDGTGNADGVEIDNVEFRCFSDSGLQMLSGTSMASPMVAGAAALYLGQNPGATVAEVRGAILDGVEDPYGTFAGKVASDGRLSVARMFDPVAPSKPELLSPAYGATLADPSPSFQWQAASDTGTGLWRYGLVVDDALNRTTPAGTTASQPASPLANGTHKWFTAAVDRVGNVTFSSFFNELTISPSSEPSRVGDPAGETVDTTAPELELGGRKKQRAGKPVKVKASCDELCVLQARGKAIAKVASKDQNAPRRKQGKKVRKVKVKLRPTGGGAVPGETMVLKLKPKGKKPTKKLVRSVKRGAKAKAKVRVLAEDEAGNATVKRLVFKLKR